MKHRKCKFRVHISVILFKFDLEIVGLKQETLTPTAWVSLHIFDLS